jgi:hypothetical protein
MKRTLSLALAILVFILAFSGCGYTLIKKSTLPAATDNAVETEPVSKISIDLTKNEQEYKDENDVTLLSYSAQSAVITIADNKAAADAINSSLKANFDAFGAEKEDYVSMAKEQLNQTEDAQYWNGYMMARDISTGRCDEAVTSFIYQDYFYLGGAHGSTVITAENYDMSTGSLLTLDELADDRQKLMDFAISYLMWLTLKPGFIDLYPWATEEAVKANIAEGFWYLSDSGLVFIFNEYSIGPYAAGITYLEIAYDDLRGILLDKWLPPVSE